MPNILLILIIFFYSLQADYNLKNTQNREEISSLAKKLNLYAGTKATIQWERVFSSQRRLESYKINLLSTQTKQLLKLYLIEHSADSEQPIVPGL